MKHAVGGGGFAYIHARPPLTESWYASQDNVLTTTCHDDGKMKMGAELLATELGRRCEGMCTRPEGGLRRRFYTMTRDAKVDISSGRFVRSVAFRQTCPQPRRPVLPNESWRPYENSVATAGHLTDDVGRSRLRIHAPWPESSLKC